MSDGGRLDQRDLTQWQPYCEWCGQNVGAWFSHRPTVLRILARHRQTHRRRGLIGQSIRTMDSA